MIEAQALTKKYGKLTAVDGLDLAVRPGELFGFLGPNGAGKTTTIKMLVGILRPTSGLARIAGVDIGAEPVRAKTQLGYVPDQPNLPEKLTALEYLRFVADLRRMDRRTSERRLLGLLELFDLRERAGELIGSYSHGMKQKVSLAAALLAEPKVVFLDEPTVGLDPRSAKLIKDVLRGLCARGTTVFLSTHILEIAERMCDRVGIIQSGRLLQVGTLAELRQAARGELGQGDKGTGGQGANEEEEKRSRGAEETRGRGDEISLEDLFLQLTGGAEEAEVARFLGD